MNICLVSREYPTDDHTGGIGTYTEQTARALAQGGQTVSVITEASGDPSVRLEHGVRVVRLARQSSGRLRTLRRALAVARAVRTLPEPPDIIQASEYRAEGVVIALHRARQTKLVTRLATPTFLVRRLNRGSSELPHSGRAPYYESLERWQTRQSDGIIAISHAIGDVIAAEWRLPRDRMVTIPNSVDFAQRFESGAEPLPAELAGLDYLVYFGRLEERKGVHILGQALPAVLDRYPNLHAVFAGDSVGTYQGVSLGDYVKRLNARHLERLHFFSRRSQRALYPLVKQALVAVLPSLWEGLGNVSLEALDCGTPVIATEGSGFSDVIEDGRSGLLVPPGDVSGLSGALLTLLADRARLAHMGSAASHRAAEFHPERVIQRLLDFYGSLMPSRTSGLRAGAPDAA